MGAGRYVRLCCGRFSPFHRPISTGYVPDEVLAKYKSWIARTDVLTRHTAKWLMQDWYFLRSQRSTETEDLCLLAYLTMVIDQPIRINHY